jgi:glutaconyl-CoA/methylmalonyl-CoA decarboxylase subunit gamma
MSELVAYINAKVKNIGLSNDSIISINSKNFHFNLLSLDDKSYLLELENKIFDVTVQKLDEEKYSITVNGVLFEIEIRTALQEKAKKLLDAKISADHKLEVKAPMPGMILKIKKSIGEQVISGEPVIILEAMKMENELRSPISGKIKELFVEEGNPVEKGIKLFSIES